MSQPCLGCDFPVLEGRALCYQCLRQLTPATRNQIRGLYSGTAENYLDTVAAIQKETNPTRKRATA